MALVAITEATLTWHCLECRSSLASTFVPVRAPPDRCQGMEIDIRYYNVIYDAVVDARYCQHLSPERKEAVTWVWSKSAKSSAGTEAVLWLVVW